MSASGCWHDDINERRRGASYFLLQTKHPCFKPVDYIKYRALKQYQSSALVDEWSRWMLDLKKSSYEAVRRAAVTAPALTQDNIDDYYRDRISVDREQDALESSRNQLRVADQLHTSRMERRLAESFQVSSSQGSETRSVLSDEELAARPPPIDQVVSKENKPLDRLEGFLGKRDRDRDGHDPKRPTKAKGGRVVEDSGTGDNPLSVVPTGPACQNLTDETENLHNATSQATMGCMLQPMDNLADVDDYDAGHGGEQNDQKKFDNDRRKSLQRRYSELGDKWTLKSGTVVESVLLNAGMKLKEFQLDLFEMNDPSPFDIVDKLSENWWLKSAWGVATKLANHVPGCYVIPGELTGLDSSARRNDGRESSIITERKRLGVRADLIWRKLTTPETDWAIAEAAKVWCPHNNKYICESKFKLPRQLHDVLIGRAIEAGGAKELRDVAACGLIIGGPCIQRIAICWGTSGDNVTRIIKFEPARLHAKVKQLPNSIETIHELLCFRIQDLIRGIARAKVLKTNTSPAVTIALKSPIAHHGM
ncbi:hypothetical protein BGW38_001504 [Lunasporangiospora selenospora]|uniref:Uncharacterized protein n=1 Tax=Lunasporangiospora selenospora TaxID=979761 RepID=A0A9P6KHE5_9FUNG|nr:hypothetical protein BGW38_001504 [Lunasporangiospora selenospora]